MSSITILKSVSVIAVGALIGYSSVQFVLTKESPNRYLASTTVSKMAVEQYSRTLVELKVETSQIAQNENDPSIIEVSIEAFREIPAGIPFTWNLPEDIEVISGAQSGLLPEFATNQIHIFELKVTGFSKLKKSFISFSVNGEVGAIKLKREILFSSRPEDSFEYVVQQFEKSKIAASKADGKVRKASAYKGPIDPKKVIH